MINYKYNINFTDLTEKAMGADSANITKGVIIFLFFKNHYSCDIQKHVAGAKTINTLRDAFRLAYQSILNLKNVKIYCTMRNMKYQKYNNLQSHRRT